jgi:hypothetical protein
MAINDVTVAVDGIEQAGLDPDEFLKRLPARFFRPAMAGGR